MDENLHNIDDIFKSGLDTHEELPSSHVWENLEASLDKKDAAAYKRKFIRIRRVAAILGLLLLSFLAYELTTRDQVPPEEVQENKLPGQGANDVKKDSNNLKSSSSSFFQSESSNDKSFPNVPAKHNPNSLLNQRAYQSGSTHNQQSFPGKSRRSLASIDATSTQRQQLLISGGAGISSLPVSAGHAKRDAIGLSGVSKLKSNRPLQKDPSYPESLTNRLPENTPAHIIESGILLHLPRQLAIDHHVTQLSVPAILGEKRFKPSLSVTALVAQDWYRNKLKEDETDYTGGLPQHNERAEIEEHERLKPTASFEVLGNYRFRKNMMLQAGIMFSESVINAGPRHIYAQKTASGAVAYKLNLSSGFMYINTGTGTQPSPGDSLEATYTHNNIQYFSIPVIFHYLKNMGKLTFSPGIGIAVSFVSGTSIHTEFLDGSHQEEEDERSIQGLKPANLRLLLSGDIIYRINQRWLLTIVPAYRYSLTSITKNSVVKSFPYNFSAGAGFMYNF